MAVLVRLGRGQVFIEIRGGARPQRQLGASQLALLRHLHEVSGMDKEEREPMDTLL